MASWADAAQGGLLIGCAAALLYLALGRIAGISGLFSAALRGPAAGGTPVLFLAGLGIGTLAGAALFGYNPRPASAERLAWVWLLGGTLVALGTWFGAGCTSGHGVCGIARLSVRSVAATVVFMLVAMATATALYR
jgi:uncharacterized membrane protein YedE/YeeE